MRKCDCYRNPHETLSMKKCNHRALLLKNVIIEQARFINFPPFFQVGGGRGALTEKSKSNVGHSFKGAAHILLLHRVL